MKLALALLCAVAAFPQVKVWQGTLRLPTYEEGAPNRNPPFDIFATTRFNYPYTLREDLTSRRLEVDWRALWLENEYLKCSVLPDVGGHLYSCTDKLSGREMFYANPTLKKARVGYRGAWAAFGIEFNFPVSHNWMSMSPVDFATANHADGSASVYVGNTDLPYGTRWVVELILRPGSTVLEQRVTLSNPSPVRHRYYWWNNAAVEVWNDSRIQYPMRWTASHGFTNVDTWPVNQAGLDLRVVGNHKAGPVSEFVHGSREPFMGVYHPRTNTGTVHYARYEDLPAKKIWAWGVDPDGLEWRKALSDNESAYVEVQAGLFRNQETFAFIEPAEELSFSEYWMPVRGIGCVSRANLHGSVCIAEGRIALNVNQAIDNATVRIRDGERVLRSESLRLAPEKTWETTIPPGKMTFELVDAAGKVLLAHIDGVYDLSPESEIKVGPQDRRSLPPADSRSEAQWLEAGTDQELNGSKIEAMRTYRDGLAKYPNSFLLQRAAGRLAVNLMQYEPAIAWLRAAQTRASNDPEIHYYLGLALEATGNIREARTQLEGGYRTPRFRDAARVRLGGIAAREGDWAGALRFLSGTVYELPIMRQLGGDRKETMARWIQRDPAHLLVRYEKGADDGLWRHLAADANRVIDLASVYMRLGMRKDAVALLAYKYPAVPEAEREPGTVLPQDHALVSYYRGDYDAASKQSLDYVFPHRPETFDVLQAALKANPNDVNARYLLGSLYMSGGMVDEALAEWQRARSMKRTIPVLHRNIGRTLLEAKHDYEGAAKVFEEGLSADPSNLELYAGLTQSLALSGRPASERVAVLKRYPDRARMPAPLVLDLALSLAEAGQFAEAEKQFEGRFFAREEGGTTAEQVRTEIQLRKGATGLTGRGARFHYLAGVAAERAGDATKAAEHWKQAASDTRGPQIAYARQAARRLPGYNDAEWTERLRKAVEAQPAALWRATMLLSLGRKDEAREAFRDALLAPERNLSRYIARNGLLGRLD